MIKTNKGIFGLKKIKGKTYFYKKCFESILPEIEGYFSVYKKFKVPSLISFNTEKNNVIYEYIDELFSSTLNDCLFFDRNIDLNSIITQLTSPFKNIIYDCKNNVKNNKFFNGRLKIIDEYLKNIQDIEVVVNNNLKTSFYENLKKIRNEILREGRVPCAITQGDPTDLNISKNGYFTDFEVSGLNSIIYEIAVFIGSFLVNSYYYYIKYMNSAHGLLKKRLEKYSNYIKYQLTKEKNCISINITKLLPKLYKDLILAYLDEIKKYRKYLEGFHLGKVIAMRFISPVDLRNIKDENDYFLILAIVSIFVNKIETLHDLYNFIKGV